MVERWKCETLCSVKKRANVKYDGFSKTEIAERWKTMKNMNVDTDYFMMRLILKSNSKVKVMVTEFFRRSLRTMKVDWRRTTVTLKIPTTKRRAKMRASQPPSPRLRTPLCWRWRRIPMTPTPSARTPTPRPPRRRPFPRRSRPRGRRRRSW